MADTKRALLCIFNALLGQSCTGTSLKPCFNLSELANRPPAGLKGLAVCVRLCVWCVHVSVTKECVCMGTHIHAYFPKKANMARGLFDEAEGLVAIIRGLQWAMPTGVKAEKSTCGLNFMQHVCNGAAVKLMHHDTQS